MTAKPSTADCVRKYLTRKKLRLFYVDMKKENPLELIYCKVIYHRVGRDLLILN